MGIPVLPIKRSSINIRNAIIEIEEAETMQNTHSHTYIRAQTEKKQQHTFHSLSWSYARTHTTHFNILSICLQLDVAHCD